MEGCSGGGACPILALPVPLLPLLLPVPVPVPGKDIGGQLKIYRRLEDSTDPPPVVDDDDDGDIGVGVDRKLLLWLIEVVAIVLEVLVNGE